MEANIWISVETRERLLALRGESDIRLSYEGVIKRLLDNREEEVSCSECGAIGTGAALETYPVYSSANGKVLCENCYALHNLTCLRDKAEGVA